MNFSAEKCELLKINSIGNDGLFFNGDKIKSVKKVRYLGDVFSDKGDNSESCKDRHNKVKGTITELFALSKGLKFGINKWRVSCYFLRLRFCQDSFITLRLGQD